MSTEFPLKFSIIAQIEEVELELEYRQSVFGNLVRTGKMRQNVADYRMARMRAVLDTLKSIRDKERSRAV